MANPITPNMKIGKLGELLVQLRLLQFGVQAAPPLIDSGNDLVALKGYVVRTIQVKTTRGEVRIPSALPSMYHLVALVGLEVRDSAILLDDSKVYLLERHQLANPTSGLRSSLPEFGLTERRVNELFSGP